MFVVGQLFSSLALLFGILFKVIYFLLVIRIILSWFQVDPFSEPARTLYQITEPILEPLRRIPFLQIGPLDLSSILAFFILNFLENVIVVGLQRLAIHFSG